MATLGHNINRMMSTINTETDKNRKQTRQLLDQRKAMERLANVDSLTGLPNRQFFTEYLRTQLTRAKRSTRNVALIFFDIASRIIEGLREPFHINNWEINIGTSAGKKPPVSVNLSALDLKKPGLLEFIEGLLDAYRIDPACLEFEVTESAYLENFDVANRFFQAVSKMGCSLALDDFGVGYSSLSYLTRIRIDTLKIDKQFVDNIDSSDEDIVVTKAIIDMAKHLHLNICAEGIETRKQFDFLVENGCNQLQGYLFFKPTRLQDLAARPRIKLAGKS